MKRPNEEPGQRHPQRRGKTATAVLAGLCMGLGMYGVIHGLRAEAGTFRLILSSVTLCCGILLLLRIRKPEEKKENR